MDIYLPTYKRATSGNMPGLLRLLLFFALFQLFPVKAWPAAPLDIGYVYSPPWGVPASGNNEESGLLLEMFSAGMNKLGIEYQFSHAPHLRLFQQLEAGEVDMLVLSGLGRKLTNAEISCGNSFASTAVKLYMKPGSELGADGFPGNGVRIALPPGSDRLFASFLPAGPDYHIVRPVLMKKLFVSGRYDYLVDFEERLEMRLIADRIDFETREVGTTDYYVCMRADYPQASSIVAAMTEVFLSFLYEADGSRSHWGRIRPEIGE